MNVSSRENSKSKLFNTVAVILLLTVMAGLSACATRDVAVKSDVRTVDVSGLERDDSEAPTIIYRRPGAPDLGEFDRFIIEPMEIFYDDPKLRELSPEQVGRMQQYLFDAIVSELTDGGYEVGTKSVPGTLRVSFTLMGLRAPSPAPNVTAAVFPYAINVGDVTIESVFRDAPTHRLEAVVVNRARGSRWLNPSPWSTETDVRQFFNSWAKGFRAAVDEAHGR